MGKTIRIGGGAGHFFDSLLGVPQLVRTSPTVDYIIMDFLSEGVMAMFARLMAGDPAGGYAREFASTQVGPYLADIQAKRIKIVANAGGLDPSGCAEAMRQLIALKGLSLKVAHVEGDDLRDRADVLIDGAVADMFTGAALPRDKILSVNAYLGAFPIADALDAGADIVVTGRVVDSALALAPLIHAFGWTAEEYDKLAAGTLIGHLLECGCQATGGTFTDWQDVPDWSDMGHPIAECRADGSFVMTKPDGTGGLVSVGTVAEQLLYEVSDPQAYFGPDVISDMSDMKLEQIGPDRVLCTGVRGYAPSDQYKVCVTYDAGWRCATFQPIAGLDAAAKAERQGQAMFDRVRRMLRERNLPEFTRTHCEAWGSGSSFGARASARDAREVVCRMIVDHPDKTGAELFAREQNAVMCAMSVGSTLMFGCNVVPINSLHSFLLDKRDVTARVWMDGKDITRRQALSGGFTLDQIMRPTVAEPAPSQADAPTVPLIRLAFARSGDKGNLFNVGIIARAPEYLPLIRAALTTEAIRQWYSHSFDPGAERRVDRYDLPGFHAINFVLHEALGGGLNSTLRVDGAAKTMAQQLLDFPVPIPPELAARLNA